VLSVLTRLVDQSLVEADARADGTARYRLLETLRQYAGERLAAAGEEAALRRQHARFYLDLAEAAAPALDTGGRRPWLDRLETERGNLRAALVWARAAPPRPAGAAREAAAVGLRLVAALWRFWLYRRRYREGREDLAAALTRPAGAGSTAARAAALHGAGVLAREEGDRAAARTALEESVSLWRELGRPHGLAGALAHLGFALTDRAPAAALALLEEAATLSRAAGDRWGLARTLRFLGNFPDGPPGGPGVATGLPALEECAALFRDLDDQVWLGAALTGLGTAAIRRGDDAAARACLEEALALRRAAADTLGVARVLTTLSGVDRRRGDWRRAAARCEESLGLSRAAGYTEAAALALAELGHLALAAGEPDRAATLFADGLRAACRHGPQWSYVLAQCLAGVAAAAGARGRPQPAARLLAAAEAQIRGAGARMGAAYQFDFDRGAAAVRGQLDAVALAAAWAAGRALSVEDAVDEALRGAPGPGAAIPDAAEAPRPPDETGRPSAPAPAGPRPARVSADQRRGVGPRPVLRGERLAGGLTERQVEVLALVAEGHTDRQIAAALALSETTVGRHLTNIFRRLGVSSRAAATAFALRAGLA